MLFDVSMKNQIFLFYFNHLLRIKHESREIASINSSGRYLKASLEKIHASPQIRHVAQLHV